MENKRHFFIHEIPACRKKADDRKQQQKLAHFCGLCLMEATKPLVNYHAKH